MNPITWIEVPVLDMQRAIQFYNQVFDWDLRSMDIGQQVMAWFPGDANAHGCSGSLVQHGAYRPSQDGSVIYFSCEDVAIAVGRAEAAGGTVLQGKKQISPEHGYMGLAIDTEGNRIAFHSQK